MLRHLKRALADNLQRVEVLPREAERLAEWGILHPTLQRYLAWRRSMCMVIVAVSLASAVGNTTSDLLNPQSFGHGKIPFSTLIGTRFAAMANNVMGVLNYAVPLAAFAATLAWQHWRRSRRCLLVGWLAGFLVPMLLALSPLSWWADPGTAAQEFMYGVVIGFSMFVLLLPTVLSLLPGMVRACLRIKTLLPHAIIPGWILVSAAPTYSLLLLLAWVAFCHLVANPLLVIGIVLWIAAPLVYVFQARTLTGPLVTDAEQQRFRRVQLAANTLSLVSMVLLLAYLLTDELFGMRVVGLNPETSFIRPWEIAQYLGDYLGRSLFITVLAADFFMRVNGSIWHSVGRFSGTPQAEEYDRLMQELKGAD